MLCDTHVWLLEQLAELAEQAPDAEARRALARWLVDWGDLAQTLRDLSEGLQGWREARRRCKAAGRAFDDACKDKPRRRPQGDDAQAQEHFQAWADLIEARGRERRAEEVAFRRAGDFLEIVASAAAAAGLVRGSSAAPSAREGGR